MPADATIIRAGVVVDKAALGQTAPADPGMLTILVNAPGRARRTYTVELKNPLPKAGRYVNSAGISGDGLAGVGGNMDCIA